MSNRLETWNPVGSVLKRRNRSYISPRDSLLSGLDQPTALNTGAYVGTQDGTLTGNQIITTPGTILENKIINGSVSIRAADVTVRNCYIRGAATVTSGLVDCGNAACSNALIIDCTIAPGSNQFCDGIRGHDFTAKRNNIYWVVDGMDPYNQTVAQPYQTNVVIEQNYIHDLSWWTAASGGVVHPIDTETHNDCIQHQGGGGTIIKGNTLDARYGRQYAHWFCTGDPQVEPYTSVALNSLGDGGPHQPLPDRGSGSEATGQYNYDDVAGLMIGDEVGYSFNLSVTDNWFIGGNFAVNGGGNANPGGGVFLGEFKRNRFTRDQGNQGGGGDTTQTINFQGAGWTSSDADVPLTGADKNYYGDNNADITVRY
jgi:hypothetical protein